MDFDDRRYLIEQGGSAVALAGPESLLDIRCYFEAMEAFLASTDGERKLRLRASRDRIDPSISEHLVQAENQLLWDDYFPSELRASVLISLMSFLERYLNGVCAEAEILLRIPIGHKKLHGSAVDRARIYLCELCGFPRPTAERWSRMRQFQKLRNGLVHAGGVPDQPNRLKEFQNSFGDLEGVDCHELGIDIEPTLIRFACDETAQFLDEMIEAFSSVCGNIKQFEGNT